VIGGRMAKREVFAGGGCLAEGSRAVVAPWLAMAAGGVGAVTVAVAFDEIEALVYVAALLAILLHERRNSERIARLEAVEEYRAARAGTASEETSE
jgi:hypothetical protein